jgi:tetratricopeptide (TPR) repeat protein
MNRLIICGLPIFISLSSCAKEESNSGQEKNTNSCLVSIKKMTDIVYKVDILFKCNENNQALEAIEKNEDKFDLEEKIAIGSILFDNGYYDLSKKYFEYGDDKNDAEAQYRLGYLYAHVNKNNSLAINFFIKSINGGYSESNINLGEIYLFEDDVKDYDQAEKYFKNAINFGLYNGYYGLGEVYLRKKRIKEAKKCFDEAKKHGYYLESYVGYLNLYSAYPDSSEYNIELAKKYADLIELLIEDDIKKYMILSEFYSQNHKYQDAKKSRLYYEKMYSN